MKIDMRVRPMCRHEMKNKKAERQDSVLDSDWSMVRINSDISITDQSENRA